MEEKRYCEIALGSVQNRGTIIESHFLNSYIRIAQNENKELYRSYYTFDKGILEHFKTYKSVRKYQGTLYLDRIILDIDKGTSKDDVVLMSVREHYKELTDDWGIAPENIRIWFSGRGYHITIPDIFGFEHTNTMHLDIKATLQYYFPWADDIYDNTRIIRVTGTKNYKSGLYKTPLTVEEIFSFTAEDVFAISGKQREIKFPDTNTLNNGIYHSKIIHYVADQEVEKVSQIKETPTGIVTCMQRIYNEGETIGSRHHKMLRLVSAYTRAGIPKEAIRQILYSWASSMEHSEIDTLLEGSFGKYTYACNDSILKSYCSSECIFYRNKNYAIELSDSKLLEKKYHLYINSDKTDVLNLANIYNMNDYLFYPKEVIIVNGDTGLGKTALVQNWITKFKKKTLMISLEVSEELLYRRFIQIQNSMTKEEVINHYKVYNNSLSTSIDYITTLSTSPSLSDIDKILAEVKPKIVAIDTIEDITMNISYGRDPLDDCIKQLRAMAKRHNCIIFIVHHISKSASQDDKGKSKMLTVHSGKGSSTVEQKADKVIGIEGDRNTTHRIIRALKSRDESNFVIELDLEVDTFTFKQTQSANRIVKSQLVLR